MARCFSRTESLYALVGLPSSVRAVDIETGNVLHFRAVGDDQMRILMVQMFCCSFQDTGFTPALAGHGTLKVPVSSEARRILHHLAAIERPPCIREEKEVDKIVKEVLPASKGPAGLGESEKFAPVEHPMEPVDVDKPARCPPPEPTIVHDGRIWKQRVVIARRRLDMVVHDDALILRRRALSSEKVVPPVRSVSGPVVLSSLDSG